MGVYISGSRTTFSWLHGVLFRYVHGVVILLAVISPNCREWLTLKLLAVWGKLVWVNTSENNLPSLVSTPAVIKKKSELFLTFVYLLVFCFSLKMHVFCSEVFKTWSSTFVVISLPFWQKLFSTNMNLTHYGLQNSQRRSGNSIRRVFWVQLQKN